MRDFDSALFSQALARPGMDPRQWVSFGLVGAEAPTSRAVVYEGEDGKPLPTGPLVRVVLQPSGIPVYARVAAPVAGEGEGAWVPFVDGDEVLVALAEGSERAGATIIGRLSNAFDAWPVTVAGMDASKNNLAFTRTRAPYALEAGPSLMLRAAQTGCALTFTPEGEVFLASGDGHFLAMTADVVSLQTAEQAAMVQLDPTGTAGLYAKAASLLLNEDSSQLQTPGLLSLSTGGNAALHHATTAEAVAGIAFQVIKYIVGLAAALPTPPVGTAGDALVTAFIAAQSLVDDKTADVVSAAAGASLGGKTAAAVASGLGASKSASNPGLGAPGLLVG